MIPVIWLSASTGNPLQVAYGAVLDKVSSREEALLNDPKEIEVRKIFADRADTAERMLAGFPLVRGESQAQRALDQAKGRRAHRSKSRLRKGCDTYPKTQCVNSRGARISLRSRTAPHSGTPRRFGK